MHACVFFEGLTNQLVYIEKKEEKTCETRRTIRRGTQPTPGSFFNYSSLLFCVDSLIFVGRFRFALIIGLVSGRRKRAMIDRFFFIFHFHSRFHRALYIFVRKLSCRLIFRHIFYRVKLEFSQWCFVHLIIFG